MVSEKSEPAEYLVQTALDILAETGLEGLSLRAIARRAGVSHGAPLRHFASFSALRAEVAGRGFQSLEEAIEKAAAQISGESAPLLRLAVAGRAYVEQAVANPGLFALMFRPELLDHEHPGFSHQASAAFEQLVRHVHGAQAAGLEPERETRTLAAALWGQVHGIATLWSQGAFDNSTDAPLDSILEAALATWFSSHALEGHSP